MSFMDIFENYGKVRLILKRLKEILDKPTYLRDILND
jgi:hypothetical protein